jgi:hypothetical protein
VGNGLGFQENMEYGIYPERPISYVKIGIILIASKRIQEDPGLFSLRFTGRDTGLYVYGKGKAGRLWITS